MRLQIKEVVERTGVSADTLRYYEKIGLLRIERKNGVRVYSEKDVANIRIIMQLKEAGFLLEEIAFLFTLDDVIESPDQLSANDEQVLKDVNQLVQTKINNITIKITRLQESILILEKMINKLNDALTTGKMEGYEK